MAAADCVLMASGTATLEGMLLKKPLVVAYKMAPLSFAIISRLLKAPFISLPNLLAGQKMVPELLQNAVTAENLFTEIDTLMASGSDRRAIVDTWRQIHRSLRRNANESAATAVLELCNR
jgi:lipid-A-disaccharide synthase